MLPSLAIQNFKLFKELEIPSLGQVNLIAGKNNTGKTALLEAISIYATDGDVRWLVQLLEARGEYLNDMRGGAADLTSLIISHKKAFSSLFTNREVESKETICIGRNKKSFSELFVVRKDDAVGIRLKYEKGLFVEISARKRLEKVSFPILISPFEKDNINIVQFVHANGINNISNNLLWSNIALTEKEEIVIKALRIADPDVEKMSFIERREGSGKLEPVVRKKGSSNILPMQSMGDGMNRILSIILSLVNCENGYFLIDEFENGLHHSVQKQLWEIIFKIAKEQNTQVFATTHSSDCMRSFAEVAEQENTLEAKCIRLENKAGIFNTVELTPEDILYASNRDIEIR